MPTHASAPKDKEVKSAEFPETEFNLRLGLECHICSFT